MLLSSGIPERKVPVLIFSCYSRAVIIQPHSGFWGGCFFGVVVFFLFFNLICHCFTVYLGSRRTRVVYLRVCMFFSIKGNVVNILGFVRHIRLYCMLFLSWVCRPLVCLNILCIFFLPTQLESFSFLLMCQN